MRKHSIVLFLLFVCPAMMMAQAKLVEKVTRKGNEIVIPYEKYVLPNGLTVVVHEDHSDPVVHVDVTYHVGSAREDIGKSGFAHFFEHMMFQGSDNVGDDQHFKIVSEAGGTLNGSTNLDRTNYYETVPSNQVEKMLWLEADRMGFLLDAVTQQKFEIQRSTVKNERGQNYDNVPYGMMREVTAKNLYPYGHPYSWLTIGYIEDLNRSDVNDLKHFFLRWYGPNNATLTVGGDVKTADIVRMAEKYFGSIPRGPEVKNAVVAPVVLDKTRYVSYTDNYARSPRLSIVYPTVPQYHPDQPALAALAQILGQGGGGRGGRGGGAGASNAVLYQTLVKTQKAQSASASSNLNELAGEFSFTVSPYAGSNLADMEHGVEDALKVFEKRGVTDEDLEKFKSQYEARTINGLASVQGKVSQLAAFQTFTGNPNQIGQQLEAYRKLTKEDVMRVYKQYIQNKPHVVLSVVTTNDETVKAAEDNYTVNTAGYTAVDQGYDKLVYTKAKDKFNRKQMPASGPNPVVKVPAYWTKSLANGMQVAGAENTELPVVSLSIYLKGGRMTEANDLNKAGLSNLFATMMSYDTKQHTAEQLSEELDRMGSSISINAADDALIFSIQSLAKNLDRTLALLEERMLMPSFTAETFNRVKRQLSENLSNSRTQASLVASQVYAQLNYGDRNIYGVPSNGTVETIKNITLEDIQQYYTKYMSTDEGRVVVVGDVKQSSILPKLAFLDKLPKTKISLPAVPAYLPVEKTKIYLVNIPKAAQTEIRIGMPNNLRYDATGEYYRAGLVNYNLGAAFSSRLNLNLREDKGWTYGARSGFAADKQTGAFTFSSGIRADATDSAVYEVIKEIRNYAASGITPQELAFMRKSVGQADARNYETAAQKAAFISRIQQYNLSPDYVAKQTQILNTISKKDIDAIAKKYLDVSKMNIVLVGDKKKILPGLQRLGYEIVELDADGKPVK